MARAFTAAVTSVRKINAWLWTPAAQQNVAANRFDHNQTKTTLDVAPIR